MKYYGKRYLYQFLDNYCYKVPKMKEMIYEKYCGNEWLKTPFEEIKLYSPSRGVIYVTVNLLDDETGEKTEVEYSKYVHGVLNYQTKRGKVSIIDGKRAKEPPRPSTEELIGEQYWADHDDGGDL